MDAGVSTLNRRVFLTGALGTAGLVVAACNPPTASEGAPSQTHQTTSTPDTAATKRIDDIDASEAAPADRHQNGQRSHDH